MLSHRAARYLLVGTGVVVVALIVWVDVSTDLWQKYVVMSGLAGGLVTFVLTALVVDRLVAKSTHERWAPVTRLALGDLRRRLAADPDRHDAATVRRLPQEIADAEALDELIAAATAERDALATALAQWSTFLASSADVTDIVDGAADIAARLDRIGALATARRRAVDGDSTGDELVREISGYHAAGDALLGALHEASAPARPAVASLGRG